MVKYNKKDIVAGRLLKIVRKSGIRYMRVLSMEGPKIWGYFGDEIKSLYSFSQYINVETTDALEIVPYTREKTELKFNID